MPTEFASVSLHERDLDELLAEAVAFHGHLCPGQVLGVRMAQAGCREIGVEDPRVPAREDTREGAMRLVPAEADRRRAMLAAYRVMSEASLFTRAPRHPIRFMTALITRPGARADDVGVGPDRVGMRRG